MIVGRVVGDLTVSYRALQSYVRPDAATWVPPDRTRFYSQHPSRLPGFVTDLIQMSRPLPDHLLEICTIEPDRLFDRLWFHLIIAVAEYGECIDINIIQRYYAFADPDELLLCKLRR